MSEGDQLSGRVAIVTGAGSGIGRASSIALARAGARVIAADIDRSAGEETVAEIQQWGDASFSYVDSSRYQSVEELVAETVNRYGRLDIMFNNAGIGNPFLGVLEMPVEEYHRTLATNQHGCFYGIKAAGNAMRDHGGVIINTASVYGVLAARGQLPYSVSKAAIIMMTKAAARDLARYNIRVVAIAPGLIDTEFSRRLLDDPAARAALERAHLRRTMGQPEDVANVVLFLASDAARFMNGQVYFVDDGYTSFKP